MTLLRVRVVPNAKRSEVVGEHGDAIKIKVHAPPVDGKANAALCEFIAEQLGLPRKAVTIRAGESSRDKTLAIDGLSDASVRERLLG